MPRLRFAAALIAALPLLAQGPGRPAILMLRDPQREPVADAVGVLLFDPPVSMPVLDAIGGLDHALGIDGRIGQTDSSRRTGAMSCPFPADAGSAALLLTTAAGLGTFLPRVLRGEPLLVPLEPCGHVRTADGQPFTLYANVLAGGRRIALPPLHADDVLLPPGVYEGWIDTAQGVVWQRLVVGARATTAIAAEGEPLVLRRSGDAVVWPTGRRDLPLLGPDRAEVRLLGLSAASPLIVHTPGDGTLRTFSARGAGAGPVAVPLGDRPTLREFEVIGTDGAPLDRGAAFALRNLPGGQVQALAEARVEHGRCRLAEPTGGDDWLLVVAAAAAPLAMPWPDAVRAGRLQLQAGREVTVSCTTGSGEPAIDVRLEVAPAGAAVATQIVHSDRQGRARIPAAALPATIVAADLRFANTAAIAGTDAAAVPLHLEPGQELRGRVVLPDGAVAAGATITLRDPQGRLRPRERVATAAADGAFQFTGLLDGDYSLFVTQQRNGHTWSSRIVPARAAGTAVTIEIRDEDPQLLPPGR